MITEKERYLLSIIDSLTRSDSEKLKVTTTVNIKESYPYIPICFGRIFEYLLLVKSLIIKDLGILEFSYYKPPATGKPKFIDYGAGTGLNVCFASNLGFKACGIEIDEETMSRHGFDHYAVLDLRKGDLNDKQIYIKDEYDVVFFYSPFYNQDKEIQFELNAISTVKIGGYVICPGPGRMENFFDNYKKGYKGHLNPKRKYIVNFHNKMKNFEKVETSQDYPIFKRVK